MPDVSSLRLRPRKTGRRHLGAAAIVGAVSIGALLGASPASAAEIPGAVSDITVENTSQTTPIARYDALVVGATWSVPDNSAPGDTFSLTLPAELAGLGATFPLQADDGATFGSCTVTQTRVDCTLSALVLDRPLNVAGTLAFSGRFTDAVVPGATNVLEFGTGAEVTSVPVDVALVVPFDGKGFSKSGSAEPDGSLTWYITLPHGVGGLEQDLTDVVVTDELDPSLAFIGPERVRLLSGTTLNAAGTAPLFDQEVDRSTYSVAIVGQTATVSIPLLTAGTYYRVQVDTVPVAGALPPYSNASSLSAAELSGSESTVATVDYAASGTGAGNSGGVSPDVVTPPDVGVGAVVADSADRLPATGAPTEGTFALAGAALLSVLAGVALLRLRRPAEGH